MLSITHQAPLMYNATPTVPIFAVALGGLLDQQHADAREHEHHNARVHRERRVDHEKGASQYRCDHPASVQLTKVRTKKILHGGNRDDGEVTHTRESAEAAPQAVPRTDGRYE